MALGARRPKRLELNWRDDASYCVTRSYRGSLNAAPCSFVEISGADDDAAAAAQVNENNHFGRRVGPAAFVCK